jgi:PAS domain S-box-containing protein
MGQPFRGHPGWQVDGVPRRWHSERVNPATDRRAAGTVSAGALEALQQLSAAIASDLNPARVAEIAVNYARRLLPADAAHLWVWDPRAELLRCLARDEEIRPELESWEARPGQSIVGYVFERREPLLVDDYPSWEHAWPQVVAAGVKTALGVPLLVNDRPVGAMVVHNTSPRVFDRRQTQLLSVFAAQVGPAVEIARLYEESEVRRAEAEAVSRSLAEGLITMDPEGRVLFMNPAAEEVLGWTEAELKGQPGHPVIHFQREDGSSYPDSECAVRQALRARRTVRQEPDFYTAKDGRLIPVEYSIAPIIIRGELTGGVLAFRDISARRRNEAEIRTLNAELEQRVLERTAELEASNKELESFAYSVSHDLRAPLRAIDGFSQILVSSYKNKLDEQGRDYLERISAASQRMGQLIDGLLNLSRIPRAEMRQETVDLSAMVRAIAADLTANEPERNVTFDIQPGLLARGDARLLRSALENLIRNAWKFTGKKTAARIEFGRTQQAGTIYFVRDDGAGFEMDYADKLFGAFQRLHRVTDFEGTGIGLATVQRIIQRHGGRIWAEGAVDKGATFYFTLQGERMREHGGR